MFRMRNAWLNFLLRKIPIIQGRSVSLICNGMNRFGIRVGLMLLDHRRKSSAFSDGSIGSFVGRDYSVGIVDDSVLLIADNLLLALYTRTGLRIAG